MAEESLTIEQAKRALMGFKDTVVLMEQLKASDPEQYRAMIAAAEEAFRKAELNYVDNIEPSALAFYKSQPFGDNPLSSRPFPLHSAEMFLLFASILEILRLPKGSRVLDIGCGSGWTSVFLGKTGYVVTGLDIAPKKIAIAREKARAYQVDVEFVVKDVDELDYKQQFDAILMYATLHHCLHEEEALRNCYAALKDGGRLLLIEPGEGHSRSSLGIVERYGTLEKGVSSRHLEQVLRAVGFRNITLFVSFPCVERRSLLRMLRQVAKSMMHYCLYSKKHLNIVLAER